MNISYPSKSGLRLSFLFVCLLTCVLIDSSAVAQDTSKAVEDKESQDIEQSELSEAEAEFDGSDEQGQVPLDQSFGELSTREQIRKQRKKALQDTAIDVQLRTYYLDRNRFDGSQSEAWALGGRIGVKTGYFRERFAFGATAFTSQRLYGPEDKGGTGLLAPIQQGYSVLGEIYGEYMLMDGLALEFGRKGFNTAFVNESDTRMTPNTFQAAALLGEMGGENGSAKWRFGAGYFDKIKEKTSEKFISMATAAGVLDGVERGVYAAGVNVSQPLSSGEFSLGAINYYSADILNIFYTEAKYTFPVSEDAFLQLAAQYIAQDSTGDNLQFGVPFSANQIGVKAELAIGDALFTTSWNGNGNDDALQSPWGNIPSYNSVQVQDFNLAGVESILLRAEYAFKSVPGLSAYAAWVHGSQPKDPAESAQDEYDFNIQWNASYGSFKGLSVRLRYAVVTQDIGGPDFQDFRLIVNYDPPSL